MKIALGTIFYNTRDEIERQVDSVPEGSITHYFGIDGIFNYNFGKDGNKVGVSGDGSRQVIKTLEKKDVEVVIDNCVNQTEFAKRNRYLELCEKYNIDVLIIIDSDEYFYYYDKDPLEQWDKFRVEMEKFIKLNKGHNTYSIKTILSDTYALMEYHRVWYKPGDLRYFRNSHYHWLNMKNGEYELHKDNKIMQTQQSMGTITSLFLRHNHALRSEEQFQLRRNYQHYLINYETLVQKNTPHEMADLLAKKYPYPKDLKVNAVGTCPCDHCTPPQPDYDSSKITKRKFT